MVFSVRIIVVNKIDLVVVFVEFIKLLVGLMMEWREG